MRQPKLTNEELVYQLRECFDADSYQVLFNRFRPLFLKYRQMYYIPYFDTDDYLQEGRIAVLKAIELFDPIRSPYFSALIQTIYRNQLINLMREYQSLKRERDMERVSFVGISATGSGDKFKFDGFDVIENRYSLQPPELLAIREKSSYYFESLSGVEKEIFRLYLDDHTHREIADMLDMRLDQVQNALDRLRRKLMVLLDE